MLRRIAIAAGALALLLVFVAAENHLSYSFNACVGQERGHKSTNNAGNYSFIVGPFLERQSVCSVRLLDAHNGFITALAGIAVAYFTFTLKSATDRLWSVSNDQAEIAKRTLTELERPYILISSIEPFIMNYIGIRNGRPTVRYVIKNYGRLAAIVEWHGHRFCLSDEDATVPLIQPQSLVLESAGTHQWEIAYPIITDAEKAERIRKGAIEFWFHLSIKYRSVAGGDEHETTLHWKYWWSLQEFHPGSSENQQRYEQLT